MRSKLTPLFYKLTYLVGAFVNKCVYGVRCVGLTAGNHGVVVMKLIAVVSRLKTGTLPPP